MNNIPVRSLGTPHKSGVSVPRTTTQRANLRLVGDYDRNHVDSTTASAYVPIMNANHGFIDRYTVTRMVSAATVGGRVDARALAARLNALVNPSDPIEAARIAWESVKRGWRKEWPAYSRMALSVHGGMEGELVLRINIFVRPDDEAHRAKYRRDIESDMIARLREVGVGTSLALESDTLVSVVSE